MIFSKKSISSIIATILLLIISIIISLNIYYYLGDYTQNLTKDLESNSISQIRLLAVEDSLYVKSNSKKLFSSFKILDFQNDLMCSFNDIDISKTKLLLDFETFNATTILEDSLYDLKGNYLNNAQIVSTNCLAGNCLELDGHGDKIDIPNFSSKTNLKNSSEYTVSLWLRPNIDTGLQRVYKMVGAAYLFYFSGTGALRITTRNSLEGTFPGENFNGSLLNSEQYNHIIIMHNSTDLAQTFEVYVNGEFSGALNLNFSRSTHEYLQLGGSDGFESNFFNGSIDEVSIYSRKLNEEEIQRLFNSKKVLTELELSPLDFLELDISKCNLIPGVTYQFYGLYGNGDILKSKLNKK